MGAEFLLKVSSKDSAKVNRWLKTIDEKSLTCEELEEPIWLNPCKKSIVEIAYSFGGCGGELAYAVGIELRKRMVIEAWGWDSIGFLSEEEMAKTAFPVPFGFFIRATSRAITKKYNPDEALMAKDSRFLAPSLADLKEYMDNYFAKQAIALEWAEDLFERTWIDK